MIKIDSPNELDGGLYHMYSVKDETEALQVLNGRTGYLFHSRIISQVYLFIPYTGA